MFPIRALQFQVARLDVLGMALRWEAADPTRTGDLLHGKQPGRGNFTKESLGANRMDKPDATAGR